MLGQPDVETALLEKLDTPVSYGESCISISEDNEMVIIVTDRGRRLSGRYAIGADGARSNVRADLGINFTGTKPEMIWSVLDTFLDTDFPVCSEIVTFQLNGQSRVSWIPRERGMARFYVLLDGEITQERTENSIREHLAPYRVEFARTEWFSNFDGKASVLYCIDLHTSVRITADDLITLKVKERIASTFVSRSGNGRVILAGDAAHGKIESLQTPVSATNGPQFIRLTEARGSTQALRMHLLWLGALLQRSSDRATRLRN